MGIFRDIWTRRRRGMVGLGLAASVAWAGGCHSVDAPPAPSAARAVVWKASAPETGDVTTAAETKPTANELKAPAAEDEKTTATRPVKTPATPTTDNEKTTAAVASPAPAAPAAEFDSIIDLATAFQLAGLDNPTINRTREAVREALGRQRAAQVLLLPSLSIGTSYHDHTGVLQASNGIIRNVDEQDLYFGAGARAFAAETVGIPGVRIFCHLGDAIYEPLAARQLLQAQRSVAFATENSTLLAVAEAYFDLLGAEVRLEVLRQGEAELSEIVRLTTAYAKAGQGRAADMNRAQTHASLVLGQIQMVEGEVAAASARLAALLNLDPSVRLRTPGGAIQQVTLIDEKTSLEELIRHGLLNRPEVRERLQELEAARTRVRQEKTRPFFPTVSLGFSYGGFGGGSNLTQAGLSQVGGGKVYTPGFGEFGARTDIDIIAVWTLQNGGVGNRSLANRATAVAGQAAAALNQTNNLVRREVTEALADALAASRQLEVARGQLAIAVEGFREEMTRIKQTVGRPLETLDSFQQLLDARLEVKRTVVAYNAAEYRLFVAVGGSPLRSTPFPLSANQPPPAPKPGP